MIKITHKDISNIDFEYTNKILDRFDEKKNVINKVITLLKSPTPLKESDVTRDVYPLLAALRVTLGDSDIKVARKKGIKPTDVLLAHLNKNRVYAVKRALKRKNKELEKVADQLDNLFKQDLRLLISAMPKNLIALDTIFNGLTINPYLKKYFFDYEDYYDILNSHIANKLNITCCPYCNRNYITSVQNIKGERIIGPTFDHYFNKKKHTFLTLSFYNLIPSCYICNSNLKGSIEFNLDTHLHPYLDEFGNKVLFDFDLALVNSGNTPEITFEPKIKIQSVATGADILKLNGQNKNDLKDKTGSLKVFQLEEIYKTHYDTVEEIHTKLDRNSLYYIKSIKDKLDALGVPEGEFYRFHFHNYYDIEDFNKKPLSKLTRDIYDKMKMLKQK